MMHIIGPIIKNPTGVVEGDVVEDVESVDSDDVVVVVGVVYPRIMTLCQVSCQSLRDAAISSEEKKSFSGVTVVGSIA